MNQKTKKFPFTLMLLLALFLGTATAAHAQGEDAPMKYRTDYINCHKLYRKGDKVTVLSLNLEWPVYLSWSKAPTLQGYLCSLLFGNTETSAETGIAAYIGQLGQEINTFPDERGISRQYVKIILQQLGGEEGRYISFCTLSVSRSDSVNVPEKRLQTMLTYDILDDKVLQCKDMLSTYVFPYQVRNIEFVEELIHVNTLTYYYYGDNLYDLPKQACLIPQGLVLNLEGSGDAEGFDRLLLMPKERATKYLRKAAKKLMQGGIKKDEKGSTTSNTISSPGETIDTTMVYDMVDEMPEFEGGMRGIAEFLSREVDYPIYEQSLGIQGRVVVAFVVERDGTLSTPSVISPVSASLDREAVNAVMAMPKWKPGRHRGSTVRTRMVVPVSFKLNIPEK